MHQHKGVQTRSVPAPKHALSNTISSEAEHGRVPNLEQLRISYGVVTEVNEKTARIRIDVFADNSRGSYRLGADERHREGIFVPLIQSLDEIHHRFGALRKGLLVRIYWRGKDKPDRDAIAEIINEELPEIFKSGSKQPQSNEIGTRPFKIFSGGVDFGGF